MRVTDDRRPTLRRVQGGLTGDRFTAVIIAALAMAIAVGASSYFQRAAHAQSARIEWLSVPGQIVTPEGAVRARPARAGQPRRFSVLAAHPAGVAELRLLADGALVETRKVPNRKTSVVVFAWTSARNGEAQLSIEGTAADGSALPRSPVLLQWLFGADGPPGSMVQVPAGSFRMGRNGAAPDESPEHEVVLRAFEIDRFEVTVAEFREFVRAKNYQTGAEQQNRPWNETWRADSVGADGDRPVRNVTHFDAFNYCAWKGKRLPSEAEWEYAARGADGRLYPWGSTFEPVNAVTGQSADSKPPRVGETTGNRSPFGAYDMSGGVWEWVEDYYAQDYYAQPAARDNPRGPDRGDQRVARGGSYTNAPADVTVTKRIKADPPAVNRDFGFRCAR
jgi:formylglycine-generating enzyme required for sulfatase activity